MSTAQKLIELTEDLIRFPTTFDNPKALEDCADFIVQFFANTPLTVTSFTSNGIPSVVVTKKNSKTPKVFLCGHFDVVKADAGQFTPRQEGGKLYGRGALDMKSGVAALMMVMKELTSTHHDVGLMLTGDEEVGGFNGTKFVLDHGYSCQVALLPDGSFSPYRLTVKEKGACFVTLTANGRAAHGSRPWEGDNAIVRLMDALKKVQLLYSDHTSEGDKYWVNTVTISQFNGGASSNMVPAAATATCDIRFIEDYTPQHILEHVKAIVPSDISVEEKISCPVMSLDTDHPLVKAFVETIGGLGKEAEYMSAYGSSDARFFTASQTPVLISQPVGGGHHGAEEWVEMRSVFDYYELVKRYVEKVG